jgi:hypothetical protein
MGTFYHPTRILSTWEKAQGAGRKAKDKEKWRLYRGYGGQRKEEIENRKE